MTFEHMFIALIVELIFSVFQMHLQSNYIGNLTLDDTNMITAKTQFIGVKASCIKARLRTPFQLFLNRVFLISI